MVLRGDFGDQLAWIEEMKHHRIRFSWTCVDKCTGIEDSFQENTIESKGAMVFVVTTTGEVETIIPRMVDSQIVCEILQNGGGGGSARVLDAILKTNMFHL